MQRGVSVVPVAFGAVPAAEPSGAQSTTRSSRSIESPVVMSRPVVSLRQLLHGRAEHPRQPGCERDYPRGK